MISKVKKVFSLLAVALIIVTLSGCTSYHSQEPRLSIDPTFSIGKSQIDQRQLIRSANLELATYNIQKTVDSVKKLVKEKGGYFTQINVSEDKSAYIKILVPAAALDTTLSGLKEYGTEIKCNIYAYDVTSKIKDLDATLKNKKALRKRLRNLLNKAEKVSEILEVERELTRLQIEIDKLEGTLKNYRKNVENSKINLKIRKHKILGPIGYIFKGLFWGIGKLFVISS